MNSRHLPTLPPRDFPDSRWRTTRADIERFLASPLAEKARSLGWTELDLFGVDADRPFARIDQAGLLILLDGATIVEISADTAIIEKAAGTRHTWHRHHDQAGRVLVWEVKPEVTLRA
jgi:hypothetical protein